jgi:hypothetical protein
MSETMSSALRFEDHFGPLVPEAAPSSEPTSPAAHPSESAARLRDLALAMRYHVVRATMATDVADKVERWASYRTARAEALALAASVSRVQRPPRLHSV